jgi:hypothetical protein
MSAFVESSLYLSRQGIVRELDEPQGRQVRVCNYEHGLLLQLILGKVEEGKFRPGSGDQRTDALQARLVLPEMQVTQAGQGQGG